MTINIAVAGKGGTGKTTFAALALKQLIVSGKNPALAVDADPNANLNEALGIEVEETIADILQGIKSELTPIPTGMSKDRFVEYKVHRALAEGEEVDLLSMGGPEGPGCYCYANSILKSFIEKLSGNYKVVLVDNEAGLEHLSRRTTRKVDFLFIICDTSARSIRSAKRIRDLSISLNLEVQKMYLVITKVQGGNKEFLQEEIDKTGLELIGTIPLDPLVLEYDLCSRPLFELPDDSLAVKAVQDIFLKSGII